MDGLELAFADGLNVLIGARGAGKTSVLELVRFALGVGGMTPDAEEAADSQARAVLGNGTVTLFGSHQGEQFVISRTGLDDAPTGVDLAPGAMPLIVSQNEIELIGLDPRSRRSILDRLVDPLSWAKHDDAEDRSSISDLERRLDARRDERDELCEKLGRLDDLDERLTEAEREQEQSAELAEKVKPLRKSIAARADEVGQIRAAADAYSIAEESLAAWKKDLEASQLERPIPTLPSAAVDAEIAATVRTVKEMLEKAVKELVDAQAAVSVARVEVRGEQNALQTKLKSETEELEQLQQGAGDSSRRISALRQQLKERDGYRQRLAGLEGEIARLVKERDKVLDRIEDHAEKRYQLRAARATELSSVFDGRIEVRVSKSGELQAYQNILADRLQGSNLQYKALSALVAERMSPRELVVAAEEEDVERVVRATGISDSRAVRMLAHLRDGVGADLLLAPLDDSVDFALLDGKDFKVTKDLSMGQRCTVVLPLLLAEQRDSILLDQPEDHLDNAFIVETLVAAIRQRAGDGQVIVATHNANIPVLGDADQVVVLASDGRRGFVKSATRLDDDDAIDSITTLMEGGRDAFARRAAFYSDHEHGE